MTRLASLSLCLISANPADLDRRYLEHWYLRTPVRDASRLQPGGETRNRYPWPKYLPDPAQIVERPGFCVSCAQVCPNAGPDWTETLIFVSSRTVSYRRENLGVILYTVHSTGSFRALCNPLSGCLDLRPTTAADLVHCWTPETRNKRVHVLPSNWHRQCFTLERHVQGEAIKPLFCQQML